MHLDEMIERELQTMRREVPQPVPVVNEPKDGSVIERLTRAALPSVAADARARKARVAEEEKRRAADERNTVAAIAKQTPPPVDGVEYETYDPNFL